MCNSMPCEVRSELDCTCQSHFSPCRSPCAVAGRIPFMDCSRPGLLAGEFHVLRLLPGIHSAQTSPAAGPNNPSCRAGPACPCSECLFSANTNERSIAWLPDARNTSHQTVHLESCDGNSPLQHTQPQQREHLQVPLLLDIPQDKCNAPTLQAMLASLDPGA